MPRHDPDSRKPADPAGEDLRPLGSRIAQRRAARGWKQRELASRAAIDPSRLSKLERGVCAPRYEELLRLAEALETGLDALAFEEPRTASQTLELVQQVEKLGSPATLREVLGLVLLGYQAAAEMAEGREGGKPC